MKRLIFTLSLFAYLIFSVDAHSRNKRNGHGKIFFPFNLNLMSFTTCSFDFKTPNLETANPGFVHKSTV